MDVKFVSVSEMFYAEGASWYNYHNNYYQSDIWRNMQLVTDTIPLINDVFRAALAGGRVGAQRTMSFFLGYPDNIYLISQQIRTLT